MKLRVLPVLAVIAFICGATVAQTEPSLQSVTLYYIAPPVDFKVRPMRRQPGRVDSSRSGINLETGEQGDFIHATTPQFDLAFGGMEFQKDGKVYPDWLRVADARSMIVDLGSKRWEDFKQIPPFPRPKKPTRPLPVKDRPFVVEASAGTNDFSPYRQFVQCKVGHMYLMRMVHGQKVIYAMFRVDSATPHESCAIGWKLVRPPNVDDNERF